MLEHLTETVIVFYVLLHCLLRDRALDTQKVLEDLEVLTVDLLKLGLPIVVLADCQVVSDGGRGIVHDHSVIQRAVGRRRGVAAARTLGLVSERYLLI